MPNKARLGQKISVNFRLSLEFNQSGIGAPLLEEFLMGSRLNHFSLIQHQNLMSFLNG
jgi:hypothetical protein